MKRRYILCILAVIATVFCIAAFSNSAQAETVTKYSHTPNVADDGTMNGTFYNRLRQTDVVTIPGAASLHVQIKYCMNYYDAFVALFEGDVSYYTNLYYSSPEVQDRSISGALKMRYENGYYTGYRTVEYDVPGDTCTFYFASSTSNTVHDDLDGYGYYAIITGEPIVDHVVTFHSGTEGAFSDSTDTNEVGYSAWGGESTVVVHTSNVNDDGTINTWINSGQYVNRDLVRIPGADSLHVTITYGFGGFSSDQGVGIIPGLDTSSSPVNTYNKHKCLWYVTNNYDDYHHDIFTYECDVPGDAVTIVCESKYYVDFYGYHAVITGTCGRTSIIEGSYEEPVCANSSLAFVGWNTEPDGSGALMSLDDISIGNVTDVYAMYDTAQHTITFYSNEDGVFDDSSTVNVVTYGKPVLLPRVAYARSTNIDANGEPVRNATWYSTSASYESKSVASIPGASAIHIALMHSGCTVCGWEGEHRNYSVSSNSSTSFTGQLSSGTLSGAASKITYDLNTDTVTFSARGNDGYLLGLNPDTRFGFYAVITECAETLSGTYKEPIPASGLKFKEWNTVADGSGTSYLTVEGISEDLVLYAIYEDKTVIESVYRDVNWAYRSDGMLILGKPDEHQIYADKESETIDSWPWNGRRSSINSVRVDGSIAGTGSMVGMFANCYMTQIDLTNFDFSNVTDLTSFFQRCYNLQSLDLSNKSFASVEYAEAFCKDDSRLTTVSFANCNFDSVKSVASMFNGCTKLATVDLSGVSMPVVEDVSAMFNRCNALSYLDISGLNFSNVTSCSAMYAQCRVLERMKFGSNNPVACVGDLYIDLPNGWSYALENSDPLVGPYNAAELVDQYDVTNSGVWVRTNRTASAYAVYDEDDNTLYFLTSQDIIDMSTTTPQSVTSDSGTTVTGIVYEVNPGYSKYTPGINLWQSVDASVKHVICLDPIVLSVGASDWFRSMPQCEDMDLLKFDVNQLSSCYAMFASCIKLQSLDLSTWDPVNATDVRNMFAGCSSLRTLDIGKFSFASCNNASGFFSGCTALEELDICSMIPSYVSAYITFTDAINLKRINLRVFVASDSKLPGAPGEWTREDGAYGPYYAFDFSRDYEYVSTSVTQDIKARAGWYVKSSGIAVVFSEEDNGLYFIRTEDSFTYDTSSHSTFATGTVHRLADGKAYTGRLFYLPEQTRNNSYPNWYKNLSWTESPGSATTSEVTSIQVLDDCKVRSQGMYGWFEHFDNLEFVDVAKLDVSDVKSLQRVWYNAVCDCDVDLTAWDTSSVTDTYYIFNSMTVTGTLDITGWDVSNVTSNGYMFERFIGHAVAPNMHWDSLTGISYLFRGGDETTIFDLQNWSFGPKITTLGEMCDYANAHFNVQNWDLDGVEAISNCFYSSGLTIDASGWHSNTVKKAYQFSRRGLQLEWVNVSNWDMPALTDVNYMFDDEYATKHIYGLDTWPASNTDDITNFSGMFTNCPELLELDVSHFDTRSATTMRYMFDRCEKLTTIDVSNFDVSKVTDFSGMFSRCEALEDLDVSGWDTSSATTMEYMFSSCYSLPTIDVSGWDTSNVESFYGFVSSCSNLESIDVSHWNMDKVERMDSMFYNCGKLTYLDLSTFKSDDVYGYNMLSGCNNLQALTVSPDFQVLSDHGLVTIPTDGIPYKWVDDSGSYGPYSTAELISDYPVGFRGTWVWNLPATTYYILFEAPDGTVGSMPMATVESCLLDFELPENKFRRPGANFVYWRDNIKNVTYPNVGIIPGGTYAPGDVVVLTAVFDGVGGEGVNMEDGGFTFKLRKNEMAIFDGLPANTLYQVYEDTPYGWTLVADSNTSGSIESERRSEAGFGNRYEDGKCTVILSGEKFFNEDLASEGEFQFELLDENGDVIDVTTTKAGGDIVFNALTFTEADVGREIIYTVREVVPGDDTEYQSPMVDDAVTYDRHEEKIKVIISYQVQGDGTLYSHTGNVDDNGNQLTVTMPVTPYNVYYHTSNMQDDKSRDMDGLRADGSVQGDYVNNQPYAAAFTVRNAVKMHVKLTYTNPRGANGLFAIWLGEHDEVRSGSWSEDCNLNNSWKQYSGESSNELLVDEFDVYGNALSLRYVSEALDINDDSYTENANFGYHLAITVSEVYKNGGLRSDGTPMSDYVDNQEYTDVISIAGAETLHVEVKYSSPRDTGHFMIFDNDNSVLKDYPSSGDQNVLLADQFDVNGDTVRVSYVSPALLVTDPEYTEYSNYGYYLTVTPTSFVGGGSQAPYVVSTPNVDANGVQNGNYTAGQDYVKVVSIPGATKLNFAVKYDMGNNDVLRIFEGNHPEYTYDSVFDSVATVTGASDHATYSVNGDTATFVFHADSNSTGGNGYGYYATCASNNDLVILVAEVIYDDDGAVYHNISSAGDLTLRKINGATVGISGVEFIYEIAFVTENGQNVALQDGVTYYVADVADLDVAHEVSISHILQNNDGSEDLLYIERRQLVDGDQLRVKSRDFFGATYDHNDYSFDESFDVVMSGENIKINMYYKQVPFTLTVNHVIVDENNRRLGELGTEQQLVCADDEFTVNPPVYDGYIFVESVYPVTVDSALHAIMPKRDVTMELRYRAVRSMVFKRIGDTDTTTGSSSCEVVLPESFRGMKTAQYGDFEFVNGVASVTISNGEDYAKTLLLPIGDFEVLVRSKTDAPLDAYWIFDGTNSLTNYELSNAVEGEGLPGQDVTWLCQGSDSYVFLFAGTTFPRVIRSSNVNVDGTSNSPYELDLRENKVVTIPGADRLKVDFSWGSTGSSYGTVALWTGAHPDYVPDSYYGSFWSSSDTGALSGGNHVDNHRIFKIADNSVTLCFYTGSYTVASGDPYGYYAIVRGYIGEEPAPIPMGVTKYSHMSNVDDNGNKLSNYPNSARFNQVVTIPGADVLKVTITVGCEVNWDYACIWEGSHPSWNANNYYGSSLCGRFWNSNHTSPEATQTYMVDGNTVTFGFYSDSGGVVDGYGYYAVIEGFTSAE